MALAELLERIVRDYLTRRQGMSFLQGSLDWILAKNFFTEKVTRHWSRLPREVVKSPSLEVFKRRMDAAWGHGLVVNLEVLG